MVWTYEVYLLAEKTYFFHSKTNFICSRHCVISSKKYMIILIWRYILGCTWLPCFALQACLIYIIFLCRGILLLFKAIEKERGFFPLFSDLFNFFDINSICALWSQIGTASINNYIFADSCSKLQLVRSLSSDHKLPKFDPRLCRDLNWFVRLSFLPKLTQLSILPG